MKKNKKVTALLCGLLLAATAIPPLPAQEGEQDKLFPVFLAGLVSRHEELQTLAMPDVEVRTVPGRDGGAVYLLTFKTTEDAQMFTAALEKENVPYGTFPQRELEAVLFSPDMMRFIWMDVMGVLGG